MSGTGRCEDMFANVSGNALAALAELTRERDEWRDRWVATARDVFGQFAPAVETDERGRGIAFDDMACATLEILASELRDAGYLTGGPRIWRVTDKWWPEEGA